MTKVNLTQKLCKLLDNWDPLTPDEKNEAIATIKAMTDEEIYKVMNDDSYIASFIYHNAALTLE